MVQPLGTSRLGRLFTILLTVTSQLTMAYNLDPDSTDSIKSIAKTMAADMVSFYNGNQPGGTPGLLPDPYYWWEAGAMLGALIDYWYYTGDDQYNDLVTQALLFQTGDTNDYMPRNQTRTEGNDDQGFWGFAVMTAAEYNFPNPPADKPQWLALAQAVFNTQAARWETQDCGGGLRWQIFKWNNGYDYKNSISQGCFFALGARLAVYTGNKTYADWAEKTWTWMENTKLIDDKSFAVYDGADIGSNCKNITPYQWTYNAGTFILGAAAMYNFTESTTWKSRLNNLINGAKVFFPKQNIMSEVACEPVSRCNLDQQSFKAYLSRWLAAITKWAPDTYNTVMPYLRASAVAAAKQCTGGTNGRMCGLVWNNNKYDGSTGVGQQMAALEVTLANMINQSSAPYTADKGGTSQGDPGSGGDDIGRTQPKGPTYSNITGGDRFAAALITMILTLSFIAMIGFLFLDETSGKSIVGQFKGFPSSALAAIAAFATGGGIAALGSKRGDRGINEKGPAVDSSGSDRSVQGSVPDAAPMKVESIRQTEGSERRLSNMPRGWPTNPSVRNSIILDPPETRPLSTTGPFA